MPEVSVRSAVPIATNEVQLSVSVKSAPKVSINFGFALKIERIHHQEILAVLEQVDWKQRTAAFRIAHERIEPNPSAIRVTTCRIWICREWGSEYGGMNGRMGNGGEQRHGRSQTKGNPSLVHMNVCPSDRVTVTSDFCLSALPNSRKLRGVRN